MKGHPNILAICLGSVPAAALAAGAAPALNAGWLLFGDLYHVPSHHLEDGDGATGAVLRRAYLTFDADFNENWHGRLRFEANQDGAFETYAYDMDFKDLSVDWKLGRHSLAAGLTSTITYDVIETHWGLRYLMRTPLDLQGIPSRDTGVSIKGPVNEPGTLAFRAMYGSGIEFGSDASESRKWMGALNWKPVSTWLIDLYADFEDLPGKGRRNTLQGFAGFTGETLRWGIQYSHQDREDDARLELASIYAVRGLNHRSNLIGRIDRLFEPSPKGNGISYIPFDPSAPATLFLAGWEFRANDHLRFTPNAIVILYDRNDEGVRPETDLHLRLTVFLDFE